MRLIIKKKKQQKVRTKREIFLLFPLFHRGKLHWLSKVRLEKAFNGYKMRIIDIESIQTQ